MSQWSEQRTTEVAFELSATVRATATVSYVDLLDSPPFTPAGRDARVLGTLLVGMHDVEIDIASSMPLLAAPDEVTVRGDDQGAQAR